MSDFIAFKKAVADKVANLSANSILYRVDVDKDVLWNLYLDSFPKGTNEIYKERREFDCNCCKSFIRNIGDMVEITADNTLVSIWDVDVPYPFNIVAESLTNYVLSCKVKDAYFTDVAKIGTDHNIQLLDNGQTKEWDHFYCELPKKFVVKKDDIPSKLGNIRDSRNVFLRSMQELTKDAGLIVLDLIEQGSLYRGEEHKNNVESFLKYKKEFEKLDGKQQENWAWTASATNNPVSRIRNTALGTLLIDISNGVELDKAVRSFERIMAPTNYKRPTAVITKGMIENAEKTITELGFQNSLGRRFATPEDITINNILFGNRDVKKKLKKSVFDELKEDTGATPKSLAKVEEVSIDEFVNNILPTAQSVELMMESRHCGNLVSLIAPEDKTAPCMLKWDNNFSWAYNGDTTDSIKQNVEKAGGAVDGVMRFSIQWNDAKDNEDDLDAYCIEPSGNRIYFGNQLNRATGGNLDVDIRVPSGKVAVENITWPTLSRMDIGVYIFGVNNFANRGSQSGFSAEIEYNGQIYTYHHARPLKNKESVIVATLKLNKDGTITFINQLESKASVKDVWGIKTNTLTEVSLMMYSPNYWDGQQGIGNKHYLFMLNGCKNPNNPRGFFNEYLSNELTEHRKVFEVLGSKMRVEESDNQLSGLGFSSTQRNSIVAKVTGSFTRTIKINF
jgi:hypothetical protein